MRVPEIMWGPVRLSGVGLVGVAAVKQGGIQLGAWYSRKTARPVQGFLGPNAFKAFRVEIDYAGSAVYFEKTAELDTFDMDLVGLTLRPETDGSYSVLGVSSKDGKPAAEGVAPGDVRILILERAGNKFRIEARVMRFLP